ncbi:MAG: hypothetical protein B7X04_00620 [Parcubacteria group bacterium 21-54-25]|nr:MAG: hypothetical protein B7X04_00620 [Parcubacteria group bacterium 21-54-25]HQU07442.1 type II toxin-antitoxin system HicA family toxin [Candidatus Paceibacterota bacterium]
MPRGLNNWSAAEVVRFLRQHGFTHSYTRGSHFYYTSKVARDARQVCVPTHGRKAAIHPKTLKGIIRQSGVAEEEWLTW